eukprot:TRINITY_DN2049_c0_g1_i3.p1 TRINITY_DN2049_c0_g1~~TRINITY_DN2049_c0_g1_i3.p1  ORF type:complete len:423 (+),score=82.38 TRINITY_DN2049_c0_g1_i3:123-1391(+)
MAETFSSAVSLPHARFHTLSIPNRRSAIKCHGNHVTRFRRLKLMQIYAGKYPFSSELSDLPVQKTKENLDLKQKSKLESTSCFLDSVGRMFAVLSIMHQLILPFPMKDIDVWSIHPANAILSSPNTKVPRSGDVALRKAIPANPMMKSIQESLEDIFYLLRFPQRKPYSTMAGDAEKALKVAIDNKDSIISSFPMNSKDKGLELYNSLIDGQGGIRSLLESIKEKDPDKVSVKLSSSLDSIAQLELLQAPGLPYLLPEEYQRYPRLTGRAKVEFIVEKEDNSTFSLSNGRGAQKTAMIQVVVDGYSAPLTAGNFTKLVIDGAYNGVKLKSVEQAILTDNASGNVGPSIPLEIMPAGAFEPSYKAALDVQGGELPVLPLSVFGAIAMAHDTSNEEYSAPSQFFFYLYDKRNIYHNWSRSTVTT